MARTVADVALAADSDVVAGICATFSGSISANLAWPDVASDDIAVAIGTAGATAGAIGKLCRWLGTGDALAVASIGWCTEVCASCGEFTTDRGWPGVVPFAGIGERLCPFGASFSTVLARDAARRCSSDSALRSDAKSSTRTTSSGLVAAGLASSVGAGDRRLPSDLWKHVSHWFPHT